MRILLAADGSKYTKKALAFLLTHSDRLLNEVGGEAMEVHVLTVQAPIPPRARAAVGKDVVDGYHAAESEKVLTPIMKFLAKHDVKATSEWTVGEPAVEIVRSSKKRKTHVIIMGTHGHGVLGRMLMGSVAQRVVTQSEIPVLLVK
jgi:nucleotide-binding universal stress UspA family protein